ncbi:MAG TPA: DMT family transporter [Chloroflexota bacterium]|nr:DMT family transporter [Chloroflexota bacterium]
MRYYLGLAVAIVAISFSAIFIRLADAPALTIATGRMIVTVLMLLPPLLLFERRSLAKLDAHDFALSLLSGLFLALHFALWTVSLDYTSVASSVVVVSTHPIFVALIAYFYLGERLTAGGLAGIILTLGGSVLIGFKDLGVGQESLKGDLLALGGAIAIVGYLLIGRVVRQRQGLLVYSTLVYTACAVALTAIALAVGTPLLAFSDRDLLVFLALAVHPLSPKDFLEGSQESWGHP